MTTSYKAFMIFAFLSLPLLSHAHPGHEGDPTHSISLGLAFLIAAFYVIRGTLGMARRFTIRRE